jgi:SAM-dependent methyltransferase
MEGEMSQLSGRSDRLELLDVPGWPARELRRNFRDIKRVNRYFGGISLTLRELATFAEDLPEWQPVRVLDIGCGAADLPSAWLDWCYEEGTLSTVVAVDLSPAIVRLAREETAHLDGLSAVVGDGLRLPFQDGAFDAANCAMLLHHLPAESAVELIRELDRVTSLGFVINDLRRSVPGYLGAWLLAHLTTASPLTRHDAPRSVRRAYTVAEVEELARRSGVADLEASEEPWFRLSLVQHKQPPTPHSAHVLQKIHALAAV